MTIARHYEWLAFKVAGSSIVAVAGSLALEILFAKMLAEERVG